MERNEIAAVSKAMLETDSIPREQVLEVLKEYNEALAYGAELLVGGAEAVKRMLTKSLDSETANTSWILLN